MTQNNLEHQDALPPEGGEIQEEQRPMEPLEVQVAVGKMINDARTYIESTIGPARKESTDYYMGRPFGGEEAGRSQVVTTDVRDTVLATLPSMMRLFFGPDKVCEFIASGPAKHGEAKQATKYISDIVIGEDNDGYLEIYSALKDAMVRKLGIVKWWWDDVTEVQHHSFTGLVEDQLMVFETDPRIEYNVIAKYPYTDPDAMMAYTQMQQQYDQMVAEGRADGTPPPEPPETIERFDCDVTFINPDGRARFAAVPPEEFLFTSASRSLKDATAIIHRQDKTRSELIAMGVPEDIIDDVSGSAGNATQRHGSSDLKFNEEAMARKPQEVLTDDDSTEAATQDIPFFEVYCYLDQDGNSIAEHRKITCIGNEYKVVWSEMAPERPFALFEIDPESHTMIGTDLSDMTKDLQLVKSKLLRGALDSLSFSLHPRTAAVEGQVNLDDVLNTEIGAVIRERQPGMVREFTHQFNGQQALPFLEYMDTILEGRTGRTRAAQGLNPDALQSSTQVAVAATVAGAQQHLELYGRMFAETGMKALMRGLLRLVVANQPMPRMVRLDGDYTMIDPRVWDATMGVKVHVAIGMALTEERLAALKELAVWQKGEVDAGSELVTVGMYAATMRKIILLSGFPETDEFLATVPVQFQPQPKPPQPSPEQILAESQAKKVDADIQREQATLQMKGQEIQMREQREMARIEADVYLRAREIELKYSVQLDKNNILAKTSKDRKKNV